MRLKIRHKLFITLFLTSIIAASGLYFYLQWSFDRGFFDYVKSQEQLQVVRLATELEQFYATSESWQPLVDNHQEWLRIISTVEPLPERVHKAHPRADNPPLEKRLPQHFNPTGPPPAGPRMIGPRLIVFDQNKQSVIGAPPGRIEEASKNGIKISMHPISHEGNTVGYVGLMPILELSNAGDLFFVEQQKESFTIVTLVMAVFSIILTYPITSHILRPINALTAGTNKLIAGLFTTRISVSSGDELGRLSDHFNILAMTLEKNEQDRKQWVADISHELRTPLAVLRGEVEAMQDGVRPIGVENIDGLHGEILHIERLVNDLYELSMSDIGAMTYKKNQINPLGILKGTVEMFEKRYVEKGLKLNDRVEEDLTCLMFGDPDRIQQLFTNLFENSMRYTDSPGELEISCIKDSNTVSILFQDTGPGVPEEQLSKLFDRLYRVDSSRNRKKGGAGLGLAICKNIVEAHQGRMLAGNSSTGGLKISIKLPLHS